MSIIGGVNLGNLINYLLFFANGSVDADWQGATKGFVGDVSVDGIKASERTSGSVPYAGTISTNDSTLDAWQSIVDQNTGQAFSALNKTTLITGLENDLVSAINQINSLTATAGYTSVNASSLDGLNTQNGINEVFVINVTSGFSISSEINITGDAGDVFILRWDTDANFSNGYQGQVKFQSGGAIVPHGGLTPANFIHVAGDINSSGGGSNPSAPYPQGPRYNNGLGALITGGQDFNGGGFFTGYWLTTGSPTNLDPVTNLYYGNTSSLSNGIFVGGWYSLTDKFIMTSGTSGVYVSPNPATVANPDISVKKYVSPDNGATWFDADVAPGPTIYSNIQPQFKFVVTNTGNVPLTLVSLSDSVYGTISIGGNLAVGATTTTVITEPWSEGQHENMATTTGSYLGIQVSSTDLAHYVGVQAPNPAINIVKYVSPDNGATWFDANTPPGPTVLSNVSPQFKFVVTNTGNVDLTNVTVTDNVYGDIGTLANLATGASNTWVITEPWALGQHENTATVTGNYIQTISDTDVANYVGVQAPNPTISIAKYVSPDNGATWIDANIPPGPTVLSNVLPQFKFVVTNTGNVDLTNVTVTDNVYGNIGTLASLAVGASNTWTITEPWAIGQHENIATVTGSYGAQTVSDTDAANYVGEQAANPVISIVKYVSPDNGTTWIDANIPPGPIVLSNISPQFKFVVTNTGNVDLTNVTVTDNVYGNIGTLASLAVGASNTWTITEPWAIGQHENIATVTGSYGAQTVSDTDAANYVGEQAANPVISIVKYVSPDNGTTWIDANTPPGPYVPPCVTPQFKYVVCNTGNVNITNVIVNDDILGNIGVIDTLGIGEKFEWIIA